MASALHNKLLTDIVDMMDTESPEYDSFVFHMTQFVPRGILRSKPNLLEKFGALKSRGKLNVGKYDSLKKVAEDSKNNDVFELIQEREQKILDELASEQSNTSITSLNTRINLGSGRSAPRVASVQPTPSIQPTPSVQSRHRKFDEPSQQGKSGTADVSVGTGKKRKLGDVTDQSDPLYGRDEHGRGRYDTGGKRGFLLILNYERTGLGNDVINLKEFFGTRLGFAVKTVSGRLTASDIWNGLEGARKELNGDTNRQYYAFICVILSHGNEVGITTADQTIPVAKIRQYFRNSADTLNFTGRPKLFFIQSCRGLKAQGLHDVEDEDDSYEPEAVLDESDELFNVPTDADTLVAFANTEGYATFGDSGDSSTQYTCFINALLEVFKSFYESDHVEDMLISVREKIALDKKKYYHVSECKQTKQMPCTWSTLTKRLFLKACQAQTPMEM